ncbi:hypothetical protein [Herbinix luporum]|jgi:hypothetical protein|uniref:Putative membrane protein n=1 Tax=Herbinix luporum TaxID=1679721 RepID=A0A0K8J8K0_9FIRM|nr:hypothetical protein [Herbinix luporum]CUH93779.1 putative membrane protein [Herbinix luporum]
MVIKQILRDLRKEWSWAFFYAVVATMIAMAILYLSVSFSSVQRQSAAIRSFVDQNVIMFQLKTVQMEANREATVLSNESKQDPVDIMDYLQHILSKEGNAGSFVFVGNDGYFDSKYEQILILFGKYSDLSGLHYDGSMALFVPEAHKEDVGKEFLISGQNLRIADSAGSKYSLFHPLHFIDSDDLMLSNTLILCTRDFQTVNGMFPWWGLSSEVFGRMVLVDPSDKEVDQLQRIFYEQSGTLYTGISTKDFTQVTTSASIRAHRLYIWFYILSGVLLLILLICNIIRVIETHIADYTVHHLYGAPIRTIQKRVGGFVLALNMLPIVGIVFVLFRNEMTLWYVLPLGIALVAGLCLFAAMYASKRIGTMNNLQNLRRDY